MWGGLLARVGAGERQRQQRRMSGRGMRWGLSCPPTPTHPPTHPHSHTTRTSQQRRLPRTAVASDTERSSQSTESRR